MTENKEEWRPVIGYENLYEVSNLGNVRSIRFNKVKVLKQDTSKGYRRVKLSKGGIKNRFNVHRLVYEAFCGEIPEGLQINHIDEDKTNNRIDNLNLMTPKENSNWATRNARISIAQRNNEAKSKPVVMMKDGVVIQEFPSIAEAARTTNFTKTSIGECCKGGLNRKGVWINIYSVGGYQWCFKENLAEVLSKPVPKRHVSEERRARISATLKGRKLSKETVAKLSKPVVMLKDGIVIREFPSTAEASRVTGISHGSISNCCKGGFFYEKRNKWVNCTKAGGYEFKFKEDLAN